MSAAPAAVASPPKRRHLLVWSLVVLAALVVLFASMTVWVRRQALNTDGWTKTSASMLQDPQIRSALSVYLVDQLYTYGDVQGRLEAGLPPNAKGLAGPIAGALREPAEKSVDQLLQRPRVQQAWEERNRAAHARLVAVLEGHASKNVSTVNGEVVLDLRSLLVDIAGQLGIGEQLAQSLPPQAGQVTILQSGQLKTAQNAVKAIKALSWLFGIVAFGLWAAALWFAPAWRRVVVRGIGASLLVLGLLLLAVRQFAGSYVVNALTDPGSVRDAGHRVWLLGTSLLAELAWAGVIYGVALLAGTWIAGPNRYAVRLRAYLAPALREHRGFAWAIVAAAFLLLVWRGPVPALHSWLGIVILGALFALGFELLRRQTVSEGEAPAAPPAPAPV